MNLGSLPVGAKISASGRVWIVVNQGNPDANFYDASCAGTWLLSEACVNFGKWDATQNDYANSTMHAWFNGEFYAGLDVATKAAIKLVKIPYRPGAGTSANVDSGAAGLSCKVFAPSAFEISTSPASYKPNPDGVYLPGANAARIANYNGSACVWWARTPGTYDAVDLCYIATDGVVSSAGYDYNANSSPGLAGYRPVIICDSATPVKLNGAAYEFDGHDIFVELTDDNGDVIATAGGFFLKNTRRATVYFFATPGTPGSVARCFVAARGKFPGGVIKIEAAADGVNFEDITADVCARQNHIFATAGNYFALRATFERGENILPGESWLSSLVGGFEGR